MAKSILFIIDPIQDLNKEKDTSLLLMRTSIEIGHHVYFCSHTDISLKSNIPHGKIKEIKSFNNEKLEVVEKQFNLNQLDVIFIRKDPPFNKDYLFLTISLSLLKKPKIINCPQALQSHNEKLSILNFPKLIPKTLVSSQLKDITQFIAKYKQVVCKPIDEMAGNKIFLLKKNDPNINVTLEVLTDNYSTLIMIQEYIPEIRKGDKRIIMVNGEPLPNGLLRIPKKSDFRGNLAKGGKAKIFKLSPSDINITQSIKPYLIEHNLNFVGIDVIGNYLTEINITSPTGLVEIQKLTKQNVAKTVIQSLF
ncbi:MAG: glutathione synthase [Betaproteobacteria bacterium]|nr:glutathione synthase [Betaproteobacteria bacterium]